MVVEAHKVLKKRRHRHRHIHDEEPQPVEVKHKPDEKPAVIDIFNFLSEAQEDYSTVIKGIGITAKLRKPAENINRSKSCSDILAIQTLEQSPKHRRRISFYELLINANTDMDNDDQDEKCPLIQESNGDREPSECMRTTNEESEDSRAFDSENNGITIIVPTITVTKEENVQHPDGGGTRFTISKVTEEDVLKDKG